MLEAYVERDRTTPEMVAEGFDPAVVDGVVRRVEGPSTSGASCRRECGSPPRRSARTGGFPSPTATGPTPSPRRRQATGRGRGHEPGARATESRSRSRRRPVSSASTPRPRAGALRADRAGRPHPDAAPASAVLLSSWSSEHAWHAELWADRLPVTAAIDAPALVGAAGPAARDPGPGGLGGPPGAVGGPGPVRVPRPGRHLRGPPAHPRRRSRRARRGGPSPWSRGTSGEAWEAGEALVQRLLADEEAVAVAGQAMAGLEQRLVSAGGGAGLLVPSSGSRA